MSTAAPSKLFVSSEDPLLEQKTLANGDVVLFSARSPERQTPNEDAALLIGGTERAVLAVADGAGGQPAGDRASRLALESLAASLFPVLATDGDLRPALLDGFEAADRAVKKLGVGAATTLAAVALEHGVMRPIHAGDSVILVVGQRGRVIHQSLAHSPVGYALEAGLLDEEGAMAHEERHIVSNFIGMDQMRIELGPAIALKPRDTILIASDGLFDNFQLTEIVERIRKGPLLQGVHGLGKVGLGRMRDGHDAFQPKADDLTIISFRPTLREAVVKKAAPTA